MITKMSISAAPEFSELEINYLASGFKVIIVQLVPGTNEFWRLLIVDPCGPNESEITIMVPQNGIGYTDELTAFSVGQMFEIMDEKPVLLRPLGVNPDNPVWSIDD